MTITVKYGYISIRNNHKKYVERQNITQCMKKDWIDFDELKKSGKWISYVISRLINDE